MTQYHNPRAETLSRDELTAVQDQRLRKIVQHVAERNEGFRSRFAAAGVDPRGFRGLDDLAALPFMNKDDFRREYPLGMLCADREDLAEMHMSSGSTGTPVVMPYTANDLHQWGECMARCYVMAGAVRGDVCQITPGFGLFNGGFGCYHGTTSSSSRITTASSACMSRSRPTPASPATRSRSSSRRISTSRPTARWWHPAPCRAPRARPGASSTRKFHEAHPAAPLRQRGPRPGRH